MKKRIKLVRKPKIRAKLWILENLQLIIAKDLGYSKITYQTH